MVHTAGLAVTIILFAVYLAFFYWPFVQRISSETKVVAELMSQLPPETDVEGILTR